jgi:predicted thioesterase
MRYHGVINEREDIVAGEIFPVLPPRRSQFAGEEPLIRWPAKDQPVRCADRTGPRRSSRRVLRESDRHVPRTSDIPSVLGKTKTVHYVVSPHDSVRGLAHRGLEFVRKPEVMASARLVELCEMPCMEVLREHIRLHECTLGSRQDIKHRAPIAIGARLTITVRCTEVRGSFSEWDVRVDDEHEHVGGGVVSFSVVDQAAFERRRLAPKQRGGGERWTHRAGNVRLPISSASG